MAITGCSHARRLIIEAARTLGMSEEDVVTHIVTAYTHDWMVSNAVPEDAELTVLAEAVRAKARRIRKELGAGHGR